MPVESAADRASLFADDEFAEPARYTAPYPGAVAVRCSPIVDRGQGRERFEAGRVDTAGSERALWVQRDQLPAVERNGLFEMLDPALLAIDPEDELVTESFRVNGMPVLDQTGAVWSCELTIVD